jgi:hypothetical protein
MKSFPGKMRICAEALSLTALVLLFASNLSATVSGSVRGVVHDPQHRPVQGAHVTLKAQTSDWTQSQNCSDNGEFEFRSVPIGTYTVTVSSPGFQATQQDVIVQSDTSPVLHFKLAVAGAQENVVVSGTPVAPTMDSVTPTTMLNRQDIQQTPGADRTNGVEMITDYVPATYVAHDMLHMNGGHQILWLIDGVSIPNTNIAANLGPQIDPKDIDYLEVLQGSYDATYGDRTYGMFNIAPRTGFERDRQCDLALSAGNFYQTDDQLSCGGHTQRFAYYASVNGNRSNYGLQTPIPQVYHDAENGYGGFASFIYNHDSNNQFRVVGSLRQDYYQVPVDPNPNSVGNQILEASGEVPSYGLHDAEREPDAYVIFSWVHTFDPSTLLTLSPFYHYNAAHYEGSPDDYPVSTNVDLNANYAGFQGILNKSLPKNDLEVGVYGFFQHQYNYFDNVFSDGTQNFPASSITVTGGVAEEFISDRFNAGWRRPSRAPSQLGAPRLLRPLLSAAAAGHRHRPAPRICQQPALYLCSTLRRTRQAMGGQPHHSLSRLESPGRQLPNQCLQLARSQQYWKLQPVLAHHLVSRPHSGMGPHAPLSSVMAYRSGPFGLCQSDRAGHLAHQRRPHLPQSQ